MDPVKDRLFRHTEQLLGVAVFGLILLGCFVVLRPFISVILWSAILCFATWPACEWLVRHLGGRRALAASIMTLALVLLVALPVVLVGNSLAVSVEHLLSVVRRINAEGLPTPPDWLVNLPFAGDYIEVHWSGWALNADRTAAILRNLLTRSQGWLIRNSIHVGQGIVQVCLSVVVAFFFYRDGHRVAQVVSDGIKRVVGGYTQHLIDLVGKTVRGVVYGVLGTALGQGIMAAIGFTIAGLPAALFWALLVTVLSVLPIGPPLVWMGATIWLVMQGSTGWAIFMGLWGLVCISGIDNVLRPFLISRNAKLSFLPVFLGVLGGLMAFGLIGVFLGPTLLAVGISIAREFTRGGQTVAEPAEPESERTEA
ncbi:MAG: AI-2E family transporter [Kiritimatiellae bacterium]|nr:AI-2E family transporter [Kiritimatiellia bacterium]